MARNIVRCASLCVLHDCGQRCQHFISYNPSRKRRFLVSLGLELPFYNGVYRSSDLVDKGCIRGTEVAVTATCDGEDKGNLVCKMAHVRPKDENQRSRL